MPQLGQPGSIGSVAHSAPGANVYELRLRELERRVNELVTARTLDASTIGAGGITVVDSGSITIGGPSDEQMVLHTNSAQATVSFLPPDNPSDPSRIIASVSGTGTATGVQMLTSLLGQMTAFVNVHPDDGVNMLAENGVGCVSFINLVPDAGSRGSKINMSASGPTTIAAFNIFAGTPGNPALELNTAGWEVPGTASEWHAVAAGGAGTYIPILASAFTVSSSEAVKEQIVSLPFDALTAVENAPAKSWRYRSDHATEAHGHIGPMAEALPPEIVHISAEGEKTVDLLTLVGVLWEAVGKLSARVAELST